MTSVVENDDLALPELPGKPTDALVCIVLRSGIFFDRYLLLRFLCFDDLPFLFRKFGYLLQGRGFAFPLCFELISSSFSELYIDLMEFSLPVYR